MRSAVAALYERRHKERRLPKPPGRSGRRPSLNFGKNVHQRRDDNDTCDLDEERQRNRDGGYKERRGFTMLHPPQKKYKPTIAKLSDGTSGMNERPAKTFSGAKL
jgi:hypothetical protein